MLKGTYFSSDVLDGQQARRTEAHHEDEDEAKDHVAEHPKWAEGLLEEDEDRCSEHRSGNGAHPPQDDHAEDEDALPETL